jgi:hypothetical protein
MVLVVVLVLVLFLVLVLVLVHVVNESAGVDPTAKDDNTRARTNRIINNRNVRT